VVRLTAGAAAGPGRQAWYPEAVLVVLPVLDDVVQVVAVDDVARLEHFGGTPVLSRRQLPGDQRKACAQLVDERVELDPGMLFVQATFELIPEQRSPLLVALQSV